MTGFVLDASLTLAWFFEDERTPATDAVLDAVAEVGAVVPPVWTLEVANALQMAVRRGRIDRDWRDRALQALAVLPITTDPDSLRHSWGPSLSLAETHALSLYDASYLEVAQRRHLPLASNDRALRVAAEALGQPLLDR